MCPEAYLISLRKILINGFKLYAIINGTLFLILFIKHKWPQPSTAIANQSLGKSVSTYLNHNDATTYL